MKNVNVLNLVVALAVMASVGCGSVTKKSENPDNPTAEVAAPGQGIPVPIVNANLNITGKNVYDAGAYNERTSVQDIRLLGGKFADSVPAEKFQSVDRDKNAVVGKLLYVYVDSDGGRCIPGKYSILDNTKKLVVYSKSTVPTSYCIYQKTQMTDPMGFSINVKDGGICQPAMLISKVEDNKTVSHIELLDKVVSMKYCLEGTVSLGVGHRTTESADAGTAAPAPKKKR